MASELKALRRVAFLVAVTWSTASFAGAPIPTTPKANVAAMTPKANVAANRNASRRTSPPVRPVLAVINARLDADLAAQFPRLESVLRDPDAFLDTMTSRFEQQKALTPSDPYQFDYSEIGKPLVKDMRASLAPKLDDLASGKLGRSPAERQIAIRHLLAAEADRYLEGGVSYRNLIEFSHFYTRAVGQFDKAQMPRSRGRLAEGLLEEAGPGRESVSRGGEAGQMIATPSASRI